MPWHPRARALFERHQYPQRTPEWYAVRRGLLTASDVAAVLGVKPYASYRGCPRADVLDKKLANRPLNNQFVAHGNKYENEARDLLAVAMGESVHECGLVLHPTLPWLAASPDGVTPTGKMVEIKCPLKREIIPGHVPEHYYPQIQVQMEVCDLDVTLFVQYKPAVLTGGMPQLDIVAIERDRQWFADACDLLHAFWSEYMAAARTYVPPPPPACLIHDALYAAAEAACTASSA